MNDKNFKLLVIDDMEELNALIVEKLKKSGFSVQSACTYQDAKDLLEKEDFDLVTLDWQLDKGKTGLELLPFVQEETMVILMSSMPTHQLQEATEKYEKINDYVPKMKISQSLVPKIKLLLKKPTKVKKEIKINLSITLKELEFLRECFLILDESFEINTTIEESCMAILLEMRKQKQKNFERFVHGMSRYLSEVEKKEKEDDE